jgi:ribosomal protein S18 acetylase RimI-like enzyme
VTERPPSTDGLLDDVVAAGAAVERVMAAMVSAATGLDDELVDVAADLSRASLGIPIPSVNLVFGAHLGGLDEGAIDRRIEEATAWFDERGLPFVWWVLPSSEPRDLGDRLGARGFTVLPGAMPAMAVGLDAPPRPAVPAGIQIERVQDAATYRTYCDSLAAGFDAPAEFADAWFRLVELGFGDELPLRMFLARTVPDGRPVGTGMAVLADDIVGLYSIGTVAEARGRGIGRAMTLTGMEAGHDAGCRAALLEATDAGYPLYISLGFRTITMIELFVHQPG